MNIRDLPYDVFEDIVKRLPLSDVANLARALVDRRLSRQVSTRKNDVDLAVMFAESHESLICICDNGNEKKYYVYLEPHELSLKITLRRRNSLRRMMCTNQSFTMIVNVCNMCKGFGRLVHFNHCPRCTGCRTMLRTWEPPTWTAGVPTLSDTPKFVGNMFKAWSSMETVTGDFPIFEHIDNFTY